MFNFSRGANSPFTSRALDDLAGFCRARGRYGEAEKLCRRSLAIVEENAGSQAASWTKGWRRWRNRKELEAKISLNQIPICSALDRLAEVCEYQEKYAEAEPLRRRSLEIKERAWGGRRSPFLVDSLAAYANVLHEIGREHEAAEIDERVEAIRAKSPQGSVHCTLRAMTRPIKRNLRWRFSTFLRAILYPSRFQHTLAISRALAMKVLLNRTRPALQINSRPVDTSKTRISLCRCGHSSDKPFCDGTQKTIGFKSEVHARDLPPPAPKPEQTTR